MKQHLRTQLDQLHSKHLLQRHSRQAPKTTLEAFEEYQKVRSSQPHKRPTKPSFLQNPQTEPPTPPQKKEKTRVVTQLANSATWRWSAFLSASIIKSDLAGVTIVLLVVVLWWCCCWWWWWCVDASNIIHDCLCTHLYYSWDIPINLCPYIHSPRSDDRSFGE